MPYCTQNSVFLMIRMPFLQKSCYSPHDSATHVSPIVLVYTQQRPNRTQLRGRLNAKQSKVLYTRCCFRTNCNVVTTAATLMLLNHTRIVTTPVLRTQSLSLCVCQCELILLPTLSRGIRQWRFFLSFSLAFIKVAFISCASAKMATPHSGNTQQLLRKSKPNAHAPPSYNRFPRRVIKQAQCSLFMCTYLRNAQLLYSVANDSANPLIYAHQCNILQNFGNFYRQLL